MDQDLTQALADVREVLANGPVISAKIREQLCLGNYPSLLAVLQKKAMADGRVPTLNELGTALGQLARESGIFWGKKGHGGVTRWRLSGETRQAEWVKEKTDGDPRKDPTMHCPKAPVGYHLGGVSTLVDADGNPKQTWIKTRKDPNANNAAMLLEALKELPDNYSQAHEPVPPPETVNDDLLVAYLIGDAHLALLAWIAEVGANYDLRTAERLHLKAIRHLVAMSPPAKTALVCSLGDYFHVSNDLARTERSGNPLDTDSRFAKALDVGLSMFTTMIDVALEKHEHVRVICEIGNHDGQASVLLAAAMARFYARDPRVSVDTSPSKFHYYRFGKCLFGTTHGDGAKAEKLPLIMARDRAPEWGETTYRKWFVGHVHHDRVLCFPGVRVEHYRTLAPSDAWAHGEGYRSDRGMGAEYYHREHGYVGAAYAPLSLLEAS